jgi:Mrp family chromosome partitioning ATPase
MADTITGSGQPYVRRRRGEVRAGWLSARTRNTLGRPMRIGAIAAASFVTALVAFILAPLAGRREAQPSAPVAVQWRDTTALLDARAAARSSVDDADSLLAAAHAAAQPAEPAVPAPDAFPAALPETARRDSLQAISTELATLLARVENAPLPSSYRALGESQLMRDDGRVRQLLDSLGDVERERDEFGASGGVDPVFVALTARASAIGRAIQTIAEGKRGALERSIADLAPAAPVPVVRRVTVDTVTPRLRRDSAAATLARADRALAQARAENAQQDQRLREVRAKANVAAPPMAILAAALVLGLVLGFTVTFAAELRQPRVADLAETEFVTGARVLAVLRPRTIPPERARRRSDRNLPPVLDPTSDAYRLLASHLVVTGSTSRALATVTGDVPAVTAVIAANIAAVSANDSRSTLLIDADFGQRPVAAALRIAAEPGLEAVIARRLDWAAAVKSVHVGRDRTLDVLPSGQRRAPLTNDEGAAAREQLQHIARRYDLAVLTAPIGQVRHIRPSPDVLICARVGHTPLRALKQSVADLREDGARVVGVVLWRADAPILQPPPTPGVTPSTTPRTEAAIA